MGAVCVPFIAVSAFVLVTPKTADALLFGHDTAFEKPSYVQWLQPSGLSQGKVDCAVVSASEGLAAQRVDGTPTALGPGTVLEGTVSPRYGLSWARVLNGPHAGHVVNFARTWISQRADGWHWASLSACTWASTAELDGLWEDPRSYSQRILDHAEDVVPGGLWDDADEETRAIIYSYRRHAPQAAQRAAERRWIRRHRGDELPTPTVLTTGERVWETVGKARAAAAWIERFGMGEAPADDDAAALASLR